MQQALEERARAAAERARAKADAEEEVRVSLPGMRVDTKGEDASVRLPGIHIETKGDKADEAIAAGADVVGSDDLAAKVEQGEIDFDRVIATPDMMPVVGRLGKVLGPKGMMPNPKLGTVTPDVAKAVQDAKGGQVEFRVEKMGIIHSGIGKLSFKDEDLKANFEALTQAVVKAKPSGSKGKYVRKISLTSTMGPGLKIDAAEVEGA